MPECRRLHDPLDFGPSCTCELGTCALGIVTLARVCPFCGKERGHTGGGFCGGWCEERWHKDRLLEAIARGGAPIVLGAIAEPYRAWITEELRRKDEALDTARNALAKLSRSGSLRKDVREEAMRAVTEARNERLF